MCLVVLGITSSCKKDESTSPATIHVVNELWVNYVVYANGTELGIVPKEGEAFWDIDPGFYSFRAETENLNFLLDDAYTTQNVEGGQTFHWTLTQ